MSEAAILDPPAAPPDPPARMRQLASKVVWLETLGKAKAPIATFNDQGDLPPFYCVHSLSGKATDYSQLSQMLGPEQPFHALQIPMANRDPGFGGVGASIAAIAGFYADAIAAFQPDGPLSLGGWSVGAVLALELAQQLRARGRVVTLLAAFDLAPWDDVLPSKRDPRLLLALALNLPRWISRHHLVRKRSARVALDAVRMKLGLKPRARAQVQTLATDIAVGDLVDPAHYPPAHGALMTRLLTESMAYRARPYEGAVQVYVATTEVPAAHLPLLAAAWRKVARRLRVTPAQGTHRRMIEEPDGRILAADLLAQLRMAARA